MKKILFLFALAITMVITVSSVTSCENFATRSLARRFHNYQSAGRRKTARSYVEECTHLVSDRADGLGLCSKNKDIPRRFQPWCT